MQGVENAQSHYPKLQQHPPVKHRTERSEPGNYCEKCGHCENLPSSHC